MSRKRSDFWFDRNHQGTKTRRLGVLVSWWFTALLCLLALLAMLAARPGRLSSSSKSAIRNPKSAIEVSYARLPLSFEANAGQTDGQVKFVSRGSGYTLFLTGTEAVLQLRNADNARNPQSAIRNPQWENPKSEIRNPKLERPVTLRMRLVGANPNAEARGVEELPGKSNYFIGNDASKWRTNVPNYAKVEYRDVYPGINLVHYGNGGQLEHDFVVSPGADPSVIRFAIEGADKMELDPQGDLVLHASGTEARLRKPVVYQEVDGTRREIPAMYRWRPAGRPLPVSSSVPARHAGVAAATGTPAVQQIAFALAAYDPARPLVIDPVLVYSNYFTVGLAIAVDSSGNAYVCGGDTVAKIKADGSALVYSTMIGGASCTGIAVDSSGNAYITGFTESTNFPTVSPLQETYGGGRYDAFVAKLNAAGSALVYSTYLGGSGWDEGHGIAVDSSGNAYVTGRTYSDNFPTASPLQATGGGAYEDAFVAKLNAAGSALVYSTYLGGSGNDYGYGIAVDSFGNAYVTGYTNSTNFPTASPVQATNGGGSYDVFVAKLNTTGSALVYSTYLGGNGADFGFGIAVDSSGNAYVTGQTSSANFPRASPLQATNGGGSYDVFVAKLNTTGSALVYSTYLGGNGYDFGYGIAVDSAGNAYVTGYTESSNFPTANPLQAAFGGGTVDAFVAKLNAAGSALAYSTYLGGSGGDQGYGIAVDSSGNAYVAGVTNSPDFPTVNALQAGGGSFVAKISDQPAGNPVPAITSLSPSSVAPGSSAFTLTVNGTNFVSGAVVRWNGLDRATTYVNTTQLTAAILAGDIATAGTGVITVFNPAPGGGSSSALSFTISGPNPVPAVTSLSPSNVTAGYAGFTLTVNGTGFVSTSVVRWNGNDRTTNFVNATLLAATITSTDIATPAFAQVTVFNPPPGGGASSSVTCYVNGKAPTITSLSPASATAGGPAFTLTVNGTDFVYSVVLWNGSNRVTTLVNSTQLTAQITAADIAAVGSVVVTVLNAAPGGGDSVNSATFTINAPSSGAGSITTIAGDGTAAYAGDAGPATAARLQIPSRVVVDAIGNLYIADSGNNRIRKVTLGGTITTLAGNGTAGFSGDNGPATLASLSDPQGLAVDAAGNVYISDTGNHRVRKIPASTGLIVTIAGNGTGGLSGDSGPATAASLNSPRGIAFDGAGRLYIADRNNNRIRRVDAAGTVSTFAGTGSAGYSGDGGTANFASFSLPQDVALDSAGNLYIADTDNQRIRRVVADGTVRLVAGNGSATFAGDSGPATQASLNSPTGVAVDSSGNLYIADSQNHRIRKIDTAGTITTIAGNGTATFAGDGSAATQASLSSPAGVSPDSSGNLYIADTSNNRIRKVSGSGSPSAAASLHAVSGRNQSYSVGTQLASPLVVQVNDQSGSPVSGVTVNFAVTAGAATLSAASATTDSNGRAQVNVTLGQTAGTITVRASATGVTPVDFDEFATPGPAASLQIVSGNNQTAVAGSTLPNPLVVKVADQYGNPVSGVSVSFTVTAGGGSLSATMVPTGSDGKAQTTWTMGGGGANQVQASAGTLPPITFTATATAQATAVVAISGGGQTAAVGTTLSSPLVVQVNDQSANGVSGITVNFVIAAGAASLSASSAVTNTSGRAQVNVTLGTTPGTVTINATVGGVATPATFTLTATVGPPASLAIVDGNNQSGLIGTALAKALVVKVADQYTNPVSGVTVTFTVTAGNGSVNPTSAATGADGKAQVTWTLGSVGANSMQASAGSLTPVVFNASAFGPPASVAAVSGADQTVAVGGALAPLVAEVKDQWGNPLSGITVNFAITAGSVNLGASSATTNSNGRAQVTATLGTTAGTVTISATVSGLTPVVFTATAAPGPPAFLLRAGGDGQAGLAGAWLPSALVVKATDQYGNPVPDVTVEFEVTSGGGILSTTSAKTAADGRVQVTWKLGPMAGNNVVRVTSETLTAITFTATALAPASLTAFSGNSQSAAAGAALPDPLVVRALDQNGNPLAGVTVSFAIAAGGSGTLSANTATTGANGQAQVTLTVGTTAGTVTVNASISGTSLSAVFTATVRAGPAASLAIVSGNNQTATAGTMLPGPLVVKVLDQYGNAVSGATVNFAVTGGDGSLSAASTISGSNGQAQVMWTLGSVEGANTAQASVGAGATATFAATGTPASVAVGSVAPVNATASPGGTARVAVTLTLNSGASVDSVGFGLQVVPNGGAPAVTDSLSFTRDAGMAAPTLTDPNAGPGIISVTWMSLATALNGTVRLGEVVVPVPSLATEGQSYTIRVTGASGGLGMVNIPLLAGASATLSVSGRSYLVGDVFPFGSDLNGDSDKDDAGEFGSEDLNILDLIYALRAVTSVPGYRPPACSDRFDAIDSHPADTPTVRGGNATLNTVDLIYTLRRVTSVDTSRPRRFTRGLACPAGAGQEVVAQAALPVPPAARLELGLPQAAEGGAVRVPVYLEAARALELAGLSFSMGMTGLQPGTWNLKPGTAPPPTLIDPDVPGVLSIAWLEGLQVAAGQRLVLGYVAIVGAEAGRLPAATLRFHGISASAADGSDVRVSLPVPREQM